MVRASPEQIIAYFMNFDSKHRQSELHAETIERWEVQKVVNLHKTSVFQEHKLEPSPSHVHASASLGGGSPMSRPRTYLQASL